jgi:hypothetical protein
MVQDLLEQTPKHLVFVNSDGSPCTTRSGERHSTPAVVVAFEYAGAKRLRSFASAHEGALVEKMAAVRGGGLVQ